MRTPLSYLVPLLLLQIPLAQACPEALQKTKSEFVPAGYASLCELSDRFEEAQKKLRRAGTRQTDRIADILGPRFINNTDWQRLRVANKFNPWTVYAPAPTTWLRWDQGRASVEKLARANQKDGSIAGIEEQWLLDMHGIALDDLLANSSHFRTTTVLGIQYFQSVALTEAQLQGINGPDYMTEMEPGRTLVLWQPTTCVPSKAVKPVKIAASEFWTDGQGVRRQCGYFDYRTRFEEVETVFRAWQSRVNADLGVWNQHPETIDPVLLATRAQRWFVSIHPFADGNGRVSRYVLDLLLESLDLPPPVLADMNLDTILTEKQWAEEVGAGMARHIEILEACAQNPKKDGCNVVKRYEPDAGPFRRIFKPVRR